MNGAWLDALVRHTGEGRPCIVVTVIEVRGSAPRGVGTRMTVAVGTERGDAAESSGGLRIDGTIGGGALEHAALERARALLTSAWPSFANTSVEGGAGAEGRADVDGTGAIVVTERIALGKALSQCCGGEVTLQFERHPGNDFRVEVFGAGHVAQELARLLVRLPCTATFHDDREEWLTRLSALDGAERLRLSRPGADLHSAVEEGPARAYWLVMTHSHERDLEVVEAVLSRGDSAYCGLIASRSKAASFRGRLSRKGFTSAEIAALSAPLGQRVDTGNTPMEVAVAAVADVLSVRTALLAGTARGDVRDEPPDVPEGVPGDVPA